MIDNIKEEYVVVTEQFKSNIVAEHGKYHGSVSKILVFGIHYKLFQILNVKHYHIQSSY